MFILDYTLAQNNGIVATVMKRLTDYERFLFCQKLRLIVPKIFPGLHIPLRYHYKLCFPLTFFKVLFVIFRWRKNSLIPGYGQTRGGLFYESVLKESRLRGGPGHLEIHRNINVRLEGGGRL